MKSLCFSKIWANYIYIYSLKWVFHTVLLSVCTWPEGLWMLLLNCTLDHLSTSERPSPLTPPRAITTRKGGGVASNNFCNFPKQKIWQSRPLRTAVGQVCRGEKVCRIWTSLSSFFFHSSHIYSSLAFEDSPPENMHLRPYLLDSSGLAPLSPLDVVRRNVIQTCF